VFDGRRRFDLAFTDEGHETLRATPAAFYSGDAVRCSVKVEQVAGYITGKAQKPFFSRSVGGKPQEVPIEVYMARVGAAGIEVPVRLESISRYGKLTLGLRGIHDNPAIDPN
jgi:hypothetical protein